MVWSERRSCPVVGQDGALTQKRKGSAHDPDQERQAMRWQALGAQESAEHLGSLLMVPENGQGEEDCKEA